MPIWGGRFEGGPSEEMLQFSESLGDDLELYEEDIAGSMAHARMLSEIGLITPGQLTELRYGLIAIRDELKRGTWTPSLEHEDIHMAVEARLVEKAGEKVAGKLHTARSRNDQVATDVRLWLKKRLGILDDQQRRLVAALVDRVEADGKTLIPGFTHLQRGQPIWLGHHLLAYAWMVSRDRQRLADALVRVDQSPLGACAMAGSPHPINRHRTAELLKFGGVMENAMDAVAARDHLQETAALCAIAMTHLSRMAEELVLWSTREFDLVRLDEAHATGSSIMPNKRNPDAAELVRGKSGRVFGDLQALLVMVKGLPLAYNRDLQEDKRALFDAVQTTTACVSICAGMWETLTVNRERYDDELRGDFLLATELADYLVTKSVPFREAHEVSGTLVRWCEKHGVGFEALDLNVLKSHHAGFEEDALEWLDPTGAIERRTSYGGTAWCEVERQIKVLRATI